MEEDEWDDAMLSEIAALESRHLQSHGASTEPSNERQEQTQATTGVWSCKSCTLKNDADRGACLVCSTPRGQTYTASSTPASTPVKKTVQATLAFGAGSTHVVVGPSQRQEKQSTTSAPSPFTSPKRKRGPSQQNRLTEAGTSRGLQLTSGQGNGGSTETVERTEASPSEEVIVRRAAGEDAQAKTRYLDIIGRSQFPEIDFEKAQHFVYPTNYSIRDYQLTIAEKALYHNTLVTLPTGLGKTLIAAVVMYNFYRWFPTGKIVFMAPTKPLVAQQIRACHEIMGVPLSDTAELQGNVPPAMRRVLWNSKRVFFCTPQSLQNDLRRGVCVAEKFVCIVVDEAHRATGNYAYCCVVQEIEAKTNFFRVLALSATPGAKFDVIQEVVANLRISHIESRSADDPDVKKYTHARQEEVIVCRLGTQLLEVKALFLKCFTPIVQRLLRGNIIHYGDPDKLTSWHVLQARERFRKSPNYSSQRSAESDLALLVSLLHAKTLLTGHGLISFRDQIANWIEERKTNKMSWSKREMLQSPEFQALELSLAVTPESSNAASHPKLVKLREVLLEHFQRHAAGKSSTRAIVFSQYRASVSEIVALLRPLAPLLNVQPFIGQGASGKAKENKGQSQKVQQDIVRRFRLGEFNVLVATCIAEEGLDIGEVDLIVSFDALTSPVRMIQRMGRTGRKRVGKVIILVTEGDEQKKLARSASAAKTVSRALTTFKSRFTYSKCPRMLPTGICPQLSELEMKIPTFHASQVGGKNASGAVDPKLWQLTDAERTEAEEKYFPPNFASSKRNMLFPVVGNRQYLLRRRSHGQGRTGRLLAGYSTRSLILQRLIRKIHGVEEVLETDSDKDDGSTSQDDVQVGLTVSGEDNVEQRKKRESVEAAGIHSTPEAKSHRRLRTAVDNDADTDSDIGSPWREADPSNPLDSTRKDNNSFVAMDESVDSPDMHFSPQFAESATEVALLIDASNDGKESDLEEPTAKKIKTMTPDLKARRSGNPSTPDAPADNLRGWGDSATVATEDAAPHEKASMSGPMSLTLSAQSPSPLANVCSGLDEVKTQNGPQEGSMSLTLSAESSRSHVDVDLRRPRSTRQLQFGDTKVTGRPDRADGPPRTQNESAASVAEEEPSAYSFALLPGLGVNQEVEGKIERAAPLAHIEVTNVIQPQVASDNPSSVVDLTGEVDEADTTTSKREEPSGVVECRVANLPAHRGAQDQTKETQPEQEDVEEEESSCAVCCESESYEDDPIIFCDGCNVAVHQFCYGISAVPSDKWFCEVCVEVKSENKRQGKSQPCCQLCPLRGGAFKMTKCGHWVHVQCFLWIPELHVEQGDDEALVLGELSRLDPDRTTLNCSLCHSSKGKGIIQCAHKRCLVGFHVSCASYARYRMDQLDPPEGEASGTGTLFLAYCPMHRKSKSPYVAPYQQRTPQSKPAKDRLPSPKVITSPSHLLASPSSAEAKKKFKCFRRLKRKYDASQSQMFSQPRLNGSPAATSPWQKRIRRSKRRRETARALAATYIEDIAEVRGGDNGDGEDDDYGDDIKDAADDSFINDSSQLLYSQSAVSPDDAGGNNTRKKRENKSPGMRAIYARSLFESQTSPLLLRRGGRHLGALPSQGIIRACLNEMRNGDGEMSSPQRRSRSRKRDKPNCVSGLPSLPKQTEPTECIADGTAVIGEAVCPLQGSASPRADTPKRMVGNNSTPEVGMVPPNLNLLAANGPISTIQESASETVSGFARSSSLMHEVGSPLSRSSRSGGASSSDDTNGAELRRKIEENRMKALRKLQQRQQRKLHNGRSGGTLRTTNGDTTTFSTDDVHTLEPQGDVEPIPSFSLLGSGNNAVPFPVQDAKSDCVPTVNLTDEPVKRIANSYLQQQKKQTEQQQQQTFTIFVGSDFAGSSSFPLFKAAKRVGCSIDVENSLEADILLSVRMGVLFVTARELGVLALAAPGGKVLKHPRVRALLVMHKKLVVAVVHQGEETCEIQRLRKLPNAMVNVQPTVESLCAQLHDLAYQELMTGYELPSPSMCDPDSSSQGLDSEFASRLAFFRSIPALTLGAALSLSFRFKNFTAAQVPVHKFNEMHWRRMLPWISEQTATEIRKYIEHNVPRN